MNSRLSTWCTVAALALACTNESGINHASNAGSAGASAGGSENTAGQSSNVAGARATAGASAVGAPAGASGMGDGSAGTGGAGTGGAGTGGAGTGGAGTGGAGTAGAGGNAAGTPAAGSAGTGANSNAGAPAICNAPLTEPFSQSLAGAWDFTPAGGAMVKLQVPGGGWVKQGIKASSGTYQTQITVPDSGAPQTTLIELGAVNFQATLSIDGAVVGTKTTAFTPSLFDVSQFVKAGAQHSVSIAIKGRDALKTSAGKDTVPVAADWSSNVAQGIFRSAVLRVLPAVYVSDVFVRTSVSADTLSYDVTIANTGTSPQTVALSGALDSWNCDALSYPTVPSSTVTVAAGSTQKVTVGPIAWGLGSASYWWPNVPFQAGYKAKLHNLTTTLSVAGKPLHSLRVRFGFRQSEQKRADSSHVYYYLNGVRVNFRGDNLQGADYDSIDNGGRGDAYDTLPGFSAPTAQNPGFPQAVTNYQQLNYNVVRVHQELGSPYMLDTADEQGLMLIGESAIRGSGDTADFSAGHDNMVSHVQAMVLRDRNHPSIVRWSQSNEANNTKSDSVQFERDLYDAIQALDGTRPVSADVTGSGTAYDAITAANFSTFTHYIGGLGQYTEAVASRTDRPFGQGEFIWPADSTSIGLMWFATATAAMRQQDASDVRPYTLLSGWASIIPGVTRGSMTIEQGGNPLFGSDNLPNPWQNPIILRIQNAFNPVAAIDQAYWAANSKSNASGAWPIAVPSITKGSSNLRTLHLFNDTFADTALTVTWEAHTDTPSGALASMGTFDAEVALGSMATHAISFTAPSSGSKCYLVLRVEKAGAVLFEDTGEFFNLD